MLATDVSTADKWMVPLFPNARQMAARERYEAVAMCRYEGADNRATSARNYIALVPRFPVVVVVSRFCGSLLPSPVLQAMDVPDVVLRSAMRFSFGPQTTDAELEEAGRRIAECVWRVRED